MSITLTNKCIYVITAALGLLHSNETKAMPQFPAEDSKKDVTKSETGQKKVLKPKLLLKLKSGDPNDYLLAQHRSHSSHRSHYSSSSGRKRGNRDGIGIGGLVAIGVVGYGAYQLGKNSNPKK